jgi:hypothetical protein
MLPVDIDHPFLQTGPDVKWHIYLRVGGIHTPFLLAGKPQLQNHEEILGESKWKWSERTHPEHSAIMFILLVIRQ